MATTADAPNTEAMELWREASEAYFSAHHHPTRPPINSRADQAAAAIIAAKLAELRARIEGLERAAHMAKLALGSHGPCPACSQAHSILTQGQAPAVREKPFAHCCAEAGGDPETCDCVNKDHGVAKFEATCIMVNCRNRAPADEAFCAKHRARQALEADHGS